MSQTFALRQEKCLTHFRLQSFQHARDAFQQFDHQRSGFGTRGLGFRQVGDGFEVGAFDLLTTPVVDHQPASNGAQKGAWCFEFEAFGTLQQADKSVLRQIRRICGIAQPCAQPSVEPAMVTTVKRLYGKLR